MPEVTINGFKCTRCDHIWVPREKYKPMVCPRCKSPYWDLPRQNKKRKNLNWKEKRRMT